MDPVGGYRRPPERYGGGLRATARVTFKIGWWIVRTALIQAHILRKRATLADLKFPVLVIRPDDDVPHVETNADDLWKIGRSGRGPVEGSTIIDSDFNLYTQKNVKSRRR